MAQPVAARGRVEAAAVSPAFFALLFALLAGACSRPEAETQRLLYTFRGSTMGTYYVAKVVRGPEQALTAAEQEAVQAQIDAELELVNGRMSTYQDDSELSRFNDFEGTGPFAVSRETFTVLAEAQAISELTGGAFDVTVGPLVNALGFGPDLGMPPPEPKPEVLSVLRQRVGFDKLTLDAERLTVAKARADVYCDLSGVAKGYAVDRVLQALGANGFADAMVEVGGEVRTAGVNAMGGPWRLGIERPDSMPGAAVQRIVPLTDAALATSGDYRQYREVDGVRVSHIVDPRTARPVDHRLASVSVVASSCLGADGLATALMVLGPEEGYDLAVRENIAALFLVREGSGFVERMTPRFAAELVPPTADP